MGSDLSGDDGQEGGPEEVVDHMCKGGHQGYTEVVAEVTLQALACGAMVMPPGTANGYGSEVEVKMTVIQCKWFWY